MATPTPLSEPHAPARMPNPSFCRRMTLSPVLVAVIGPGPATRTEVTKRVWDYIKARNLQDPQKRSSVNADDKLFAVLGKREVTMFEMTMLLNPHLS